MWGVFAGIPFGLLQVYVLYKFTVRITTGEKNRMLLWLIPLDLVILIGMFVLIGILSEAQLLWFATGMVATMIILTITMFIINLNRNRSKS